MTTQSAPVWIKRPRRSAISRDEIIRKEQARLTKKNPASITLPKVPWAKEATK